MVRIEVTVSPGAARTDLVGRHGEGWKARIAVPPERGRANDALCDLLAERLGVERNRVAVVGGRTSRRKVVEIAGIDRAEVERRLDSAST
jgi:uncharacterized protein (TIGR00251 family)